MYVTEEAWVLVVKSPKSMFGLNDCLNLTCCRVITSSLGPRTSLQLYFLFGDLRTLITLPYAGLASIVLNYVP